MKKKFAYAASKLGAEHAPWCTFLSKKRKRRVARTCTICSHESREEHPGAASILSMHNEIVLEYATEDAEVADQWLSSTMRKAVEDVLGHPELAGEDVVKTSVVHSRGGGVGAQDQQIATPYSFSAGTLRRHLRRFLNTYPELKRWHYWA